MTTYSALYYHLIWATKNRTPIISENIEKNFHAYIAGVIEKNSGTVIQVGGMPDHIHLLIRLKPDQNISDLVKTLKISSGNWLKKINPIFKNFSWQIGFGVFSVSKSQTSLVQNYIVNQKEHHKKRQFDEEWIAFLDNHNIEYDPKYVLT